VRRHLSFANVTASAALFLALAGGTTAIALGGGGGSGKAKPLKRSGVMSSRITGIDQTAQECGPVSGVGAASDGCSPAADPLVQISPAIGYRARDLAVKLSAPSTVPGASRTFTLLANGDDILSCTVLPNESACADKENLGNVPASSELMIRESPGNGAVVSTDAMVSFRLTKP
jgi:hypothetical protein